MASPCEPNVVLPALVANLASQVNSSRSKHRHCRFSAAACHERPTSCHQTRDLRFPELPTLHRPRTWTLPGQLAREARTRNSRVQSNTHDKGTSGIFLHAAATVVRSTCMQGGLRTTGEYASRAWGSQPFPVHIRWVVVPDPS